jgi:hypothetical protein
VIPIVEPIQKVNAFTKKGKHQSGVLWTRDREHELPIAGVTFLEFLQHPNFNAACLAILLYGSDDLDSNPFVCLNVDCFDNFTECSLTKQPNSAI